MVSVTESEQQKLAEIGGEVSEVVARARTIEVASEADAREATGFLAEVKAAKDRSERARRFLVDPLTKHVRAINEQVKGAVAPLDEARELVARKLLAFRQAQERERERLQAELERERQAAEREAAEARRAAWERARAAQKAAEDAERTDAANMREANAEAAAAHQTAEEATQRQIAAASAPALTVAGPAPLNAENGSASVSHRWKATVLDPEQVPRQYLVVDMKAINAAVRAGVREIPGVRVEQVAGLAVRAR